MSIKQINDLKAVAEEYGLADNITNLHLLEVVHFVVLGIEFNTNWLKLAFANDLNALMRDKPLGVDLEMIEAVCEFICNWVPTECWGSVEKVESWEGSFYIS